jgi:hypothetical protein
LCCSVLEKVHPNRKNFGEMVGTVSATTGTECTAAQHWRRDQPMMWHGCHETQTETTMPLVPIDELLCLASAQTNLLLEGQPSQVDAILAALVPHMLPPLTTWDGAAPLPTEHRGTVIALQVNRLDGDQQRQLLRWIQNADGAGRVIATASGSLFGLVERGMFVDTLYYLLNILRLDVSK